MCCWLELTWYPPFQSLEARYGGKGKGRGAAAFVEPTDEEFEAIQKRYGTLAAETSSRGCAPLSDDEPRLGRRMRSRKEDATKRKRRVAAKAREEEDLDDEEEEQEEEKKAAKKRRTARK